MPILKKKKALIFIFQQRIFLNVNVNIIIINYARRIDLEKEKENSFNSLINTMLRSHKFIKLINK